MGQTLDHDLDGAGDVGELVGEVARYVQGEAFGVGREVRRGQADQELNRMIQAVQEGPEATEKPLLVVPRRQIQLDGTDLEDGNGHTVLAQQVVRPDAAERQVLF